jgi:hypothetical protein
MKYKTDSLAPLCYVQTTRARARARGRGSLVCGWAHESRQQSEPHEPVARVAPTVVDTQRDAPKPVKDGDTCSSDNTQYWQCKHGEDE